MPSIRRGSSQPPTKVMRNGIEIQRIMRGQQEAWSASPYPVSGTFEIVNGAPLQSYEVFSHTVVESGDFTGTIVVEGGTASSLSWSVNGGSRTSGLEGTRSFTDLSVGDTIKLEAVAYSTLNFSGTWSIVKN